MCITYGGGGGGHKRKRSGNNMYIAADMSPSTVRLRSSNETIVENKQEVNHPNACLIDRKISKIQK